jgi:hypothetical protein
MRTQNMNVMLALVCGAMTPLLAAPAHAASKVYAATTSAAVTLESGSEVPTTILNYTIPSGAWLITAKADVVNFDAPDYERCGITVGSKTADISTQATTAGAAAANIISQAAVVTSGSTMVTLFCQHDNTASGEYVDPNASLLAQKVGSIVK